MPSFGSGARVIEHRHGPAVGARFFLKSAMYLPAWKFSILPQMPQKPAMRVAKETVGHRQARRHSGIDGSLPI